MDNADYLLQQYTTSDMDFFAKMDAVQKGLDEISRYPLGVRDENDRNGERPYPFLATSPYPELSLNEHCTEIFNMKYLFSSWLYPFMLDSLGFPYLMSTVAKRIDNSAQVSWGAYHYLIVVTYNGKSADYGGAGAGTDGECFFTKHIDQYYTFDDSASDYAAQASVNSLYDQLIKYYNYALSDLHPYMDQISGTGTFSQSIGNGTWVRVVQEGGSYIPAYAYISKSSHEGSAPRVASDCWVDGRYISQYEHWEYGAKFSDHPDSSIIIRNMSYTDPDGTPKTGDVLFWHDSDSDTWRASDYFYMGSGNSELSDDLILTRDEVNQMSLDANTDSTPGTYKIFDGTAVPGTEYTASLPASIDLSGLSDMYTAGSSTKISCHVYPEDADQQIYFTISDNSIADMETVIADNELTDYLTAKKPGIITITAVSRANPDLKVSKTVHITFSDVENSSRYYFDPVYWAVGEDVTTGTGEWLFSPDKSCTRGQIVTLLWRALGSPEPVTTSARFTDTASDQYYYKAVLWAVENGITDGTGTTTFSPDQTCNRAQALTFIWRTLNSPKAAAGSSFSDVPASAYYKDAVDWGVENSITNGVDNNRFAPNQYCTRGQIITFIYNARSLLMK